MSPVQGRSQNVRTPPSPGFQNLANRSTLKGKQRHNSSSITPETSPSVAHSSALLGTKTGPYSDSRFHASPFKGLSSSGFQHPSKQLQGDSEPSDPYNATDCSKSLVHTSRIRALSPLRPQDYLGPHMVCFCDRYSYRSYLPLLRENYSERTPSEEDCEDTRPSSFPTRQPPTNASNSLWILSE